MGPLAARGLLPEPGLRVPGGCGHFPLSDRTKAVAEAIFEWGEAHIPPFHSLTRSHTLSAASAL
jgi:hypothetical protein